MHEPEPMDPTERWQTTLDRAGLRDPGHATLRELETLYSQSHRHYHDLQHILDCLQHLDAHPTPGSDPTALELAIWFHDAVYSPFKKDNERASADLATRHLTSMGAGPGLRRKVQRLILITTHDAEPSDLDESLMIDVDLATLGSDRKTFETYETSIRREYRLVPGLLYRRKRKALLESFLSRPAIYTTPAFRERLEERARSNLTWAVSGLTGRK